MAMDAGVATRNLATGSRYDLPSKMFNDALDAYTTPPEGLGKGAEFVSSVLAGSRINPTSGIRGPQQLAPYAGAKMPPINVAPTARDVALQGAQQAGAVVPPSSVRPTLANRMMESIGGKIATAQDAEAANQAVWNKLARRALGTADDSALTPDVLDSVRRGAAAGMQGVREVGKVTTDTQFADDLAAITSRQKSAAKDFPDIAKDEISAVVESVNKKEFDSASAVDAISLLREKASKAYASGDKTLGRAYKAVTSALEGAIERQLVRAGEAGKEVLKQFRDGRALIAKTYSVEKALNPATGNVNAAKLGQQLVKGAPLSGDLLTIGRFGAAFPKASREVLDSGAVRNTDVLAGMATSALAKDPAFLLYPFLRQGVRSGLLSPQGQALTQPGGPVGTALPAGLLPQMEQLFAQ